ncbi:uncharacterized protein EI97DRAFT_308695 [Westerdykella ornata]|uniref:Uncharacterized protein n=1 Tax=Westerdykella ornata TaxID=318751 RepID=A0A6A6JQ38_WESOR|nr:uncharacterized protein EI97DRAFT_308695 [Westerdykella ornata]KAF2277079.1 hypothetical protein EI97DRAFT_308695 [Westerdykella ornata]
MTQSADPPGGIHTHQRRQPRAEHQQTEHNSSALCLTHLLVWHLQASSHGTSTPSEPRRADQQCRIPMSGPEMPQPYPVPSEPAHHHAMIANVGHLQHVSER